MSQIESTRGLSNGGHESLINGGILIALGLSIFILNVWHQEAVTTTIALAWSLFFLLLKGPELVRRVRRID